MITTQFMSEIAYDIAKQRDAVFLEQLNDLVSIDLLVIEQGQMSLVQSPLDNKIEIRQTVKLVLKDKKYIERLENQVKDLTERLDSIKNAIGGL